MQKYLVIEQIFFVDSEGTPDEGQVVKKITSGERADKFYSEWEKNKDKFLDGDSWVEEEDVSAAQDGYNSNCSTYEIKKITEEEAILYQEIIDNYNNLN